MSSTSATAHSLAQEQQTAKCSRTSVASGGLRVPSRSTSREWSTASHLIQIGSRFKLVSRLQGAEARLLDQVLDLFPMMRQPPGETVERIKVLEQ